MSVIQFKKIIHGWRYVLIFGPIIFAIALGLRLFHLDLLPVFADEAIYIRWSQIMANEPTLRFLPLSDGKQPLFMWVLMFFVRRFSDPLFVSRLVSVFSGIGTLIGIFVLSYVLFKNKLLSLISSFIWAISPYSLFFDRMALVDSMLATFGVWTAVFGVLMARTKRLDFAILAGFSLGLASLTKSPAIFFALLLPLAFIFSAWPKSWQGRMTNLVKLGALLLTSYLLAFGMYNIQRLGPNFHLLALRTADYVFPISHLWLNPRDPFIFHFDRAIEWLKLMGPWPILAMSLAGYLVNWRKYWKALFFLTGWWLVPTLVQSEFAKVFTARYEVFTLPYIFIIGALGFLATNKIIRGLWIFSFASFIVLSGIFNFYLLTDPAKANLPTSERSGYLEEWTAGTGIARVADYLREHKQKNPGTKIVVGTEGYFGTLPDGLQIYLEGVPDITVIGVGLEIKEIPIQLAESVRSGNETYLVINSSRLKINEADFEKSGLELVESYKKAERKLKDTHEYLWYGPYETLYLLKVI